MELSINTHGLWATQRGLRRGAFWAATLLWAVATARAQAGDNPLRLRLWQSGDGRELSADATQVWSYNLYEQSRWGLGVALEQAAPAAGRRVAHDYAADVAYSPHAHLWSGGVSAAMHRADYRGRYLRTTLYHRVEGVGSRLIAPPSARVAGGSLDATIGGLMNHRMDERYRATVGYGRADGAWPWEVSASGWRGRRLYDHSGLLYPHLGDLPPREDGAELRAVAMHRIGAAWPLELAAQVQLGFTTRPMRPYVRTLAQAATRQTAGPLLLQAAMQAGLVNSGVSYGNLFDLGGTLGSPLYLATSILTARPNEFTAHSFVAVWTRVQWHEPLLDRSSRLRVISCQPRPFVGLNAYWGALWDGDPQGAAEVDGLALQAPLMGMAEVVAGVDQVLNRWGAAVALRLSPPGAPYADGHAARHLALVLTLTI